MNQRRLLSSLLFLNHPFGTKAFVQLLDILSKTGFRVKRMKPEGFSRLRQVYSEPEKKYNLFIFPVLNGWDLVFDINRSKRPSILDVFDLLSVPVDL